MRILGEGSAGDAMTERVAGLLPLAAVLPQEVT